MPMDKAKAVVDQAARKAGRQNKLAYATGSPVHRDQKYDLKEVGDAVQRAAESGFLYYAASFPQETYMETMKQFAKQIMPSYTGLD